jgi:hypothetical protein
MLRNLKASFSYRLAKIRGGRGGNYESRLCALRDSPRFFARGVARNEQEAVKLLNVKEQKEYIRILYLLKRFHKPPNTLR